MGPQSASLYPMIANYPCYKNLQGSFAWMDAMVVQAASFNGLSVTKSDIGDSYIKTKNIPAGYDIRALKITGDAGGVATKGILFIMSGIHTRKMTPPQLASRWVETLINRYGNDADITAMLDSTKIHLVLQANPDGLQVAEMNPSVLRCKNMNPGTAIKGKTPCTQTQI
jgi:carboxypeptidase T